MALNPLPYAGKCIGCRNTLELFIGTLGGELNKELLGRYHRMVLYGLVTNPGGDTI
jgi:hypothetical protein